MRSRDIPVCAAIVASHPILGPRYGEALVHLAAVWEKLLAGDSLVAEVFEEISEGHPVVLGAGIAAFVTDDFVRELKRPPHFWLGREIVLRSARGQSPVLSDKELQRANSTEGLNIAIWQCGILPENVARVDVASCLMSSFVEGVRGFQLKEHVVQGESLSHVEGVRAAGVLLWSTVESCYQTFHDLPAQTLLAECHLLGISRDHAYRHPGSWAASTFVYTPPRICFNRSEQRLLWSALAGGTDEELAAKLAFRWPACEKPGASSTNAQPRPSPSLLRIRVIERESQPNGGKKGSIESSPLFASTRRNYARSPVSCCVPKSHGQADRNPRPRKGCSRPGGLRDHQ